MRIAIIDCDLLDKEISKLFGNYAEMIHTNLFGNYPTIEVDCFSAVCNQLPTDTNYDGVIISGSRFDSFSNISWIINLKNWCAETKIPAVGICFGHQILALAHGGRVERAKEWGVGNKKLTIVSERQWMSDKGLALGMMVMHQDEVTQLPISAIHTMKTQHCHYFGFEIPNRCISFQGHPEYQSGYMRLLIERRRTKLSKKTIDDALRSIILPTTRHVVVKWICNFLSFQKTKQNKSIN